MRASFLILLLFISYPVSAQNVVVPTALTAAQRTLIRNIDIDGFVLGDKSQFVKLFKPYRNKYLTGTDIDAILQKIQAIYEQEGYAQLVSIGYQVTKHRLVFTILMIS